MAGIRLIACPFCNGDSLQVIRDEAPIYRVQCMACGATGPFGPRGLIAKQKWNARDSYPERYVVMSNAIVDIDAFIDDGEVPNIDWTPDDVQLFVTKCNEREKLLITRLQKAIRHERRGVTEGLPGTVLPDHRNADAAGERSGEGDCS